MDNEIQLISDGDGLTVIGNAKDVENFLVSEGLPSKDLGPRWLKSVFGTGAAVAQAGSEIAANSAHWVKLKPKSARLFKKDHGAGCDATDHGRPRPPTHLRSSRALCGGLLVRQMPGHDCGLSGHSR
ncbi:hypothetical protein [Streptomyces sp. NBC_00401]|uniref:hypothetical protein n=1 Tax=Streptomyces sp. NBC_00401 TaxID=2975738 RepID=UPI002250A1E4|nr:hypothetical protein [Streptomyces sp. NBC_00401]MCX5083704.1 hypothetical protein [Streptomyces sp. NBC_00401]